MIFRRFFRGILTNLVISLLTLAVLALLRRLAEQKREDESHAPSSETTVHW
jgi:hypothetical protein